jgi:excisionase family DNA binding protein
MFRIEKDEKEVYGTAEIAKKLGVCSDTVLRWIKSGKLKARMMSGGYYRVLSDDLQEFINLPARTNLPRGVVSNRIKRIEKNKKEEDDDDWFF